MKSIAPHSALRRSPLYHVHTEAGAQSEFRNGCDIVTRYPGVADNARLLLTDLSTLPRSGFTGPGAPLWLEKQGMTLPATPNAAVLQSDGTLVARLSATEQLLLSNYSQWPHCMELLAGHWVPGETPGVHRLERADSHAWLRLAGKQAATVLARLCAVDLSREQFANLSVAQTVLADITAIIVRDDLQGHHAFHLLCDSSAAVYLWQCLLETLADVGGQAAGLDDLFPTLPTTGQGDAVGNRW